MTDASLRGEFDSIRNIPLLAKDVHSSSEEEDFEAGNNQVELKDDIDIEDEQKFKKLIQGDHNLSVKNDHIGKDFQLIEQDPLALKAQERDDVEERMSFNLQSRTSFFIINAILMSVCQCIQANKKKNNVVGMMGGLIKFAQKAITYQLKDDDVNHLMDMADYFVRNEDICATDVTNGRKVLVKITEFCPELLRPIRKASGFTEDFLLQAFCPRENYAEMTKFQEGSGKSASFFFFTANKKFVLECRIY